MMITFESSGDEEMSTAELLLEEITALRLAFSQGLLQVGGLDVTRERSAYWLDDIPEQRLLKHVDVADSIRYIYINAIKKLLRS